jgi:hypothetical protein
MLLKPGLGREKKKELEGKPFKGKYKRLIYYPIKYKTIRHRYKPS